MGLILNTSLVIDACDAAIYSRSHRRGDRSYTKATTVIIAASVLECASVQSSKSQKSDDEVGNICTHRKFSNKLHTQ